MINGYMWGFGVCFPPLSHKSDRCITLGTVFLYLIVLLLLTLLIFHVFHWSVKLEIIKFELLLSSSVIAKFHLDLLPLCLYSPCSFHCTLHCCFCFLPWKQLVWIKEQVSNPTYELFFSWDKWTFLTTNQSSRKGLSKLLGFHQHEHIYYCCCFT